MASLNRVQLIGHLSAPVELRQTQSGTSVGAFSLATNDSYTSKMGEKTENVEWHNIVVWGKRAEVCSKYLTKGSLVLVEGKIKTEKYTDNQNQQRYSTKIVAHDIQFLSTNKRNDIKTQDSMPTPNTDIDDIPF